MFVCLGHTQLIVQVTHKIKRIVLEKKLCKAKTTVKMCLVCSDVDLWCFTRPELHLKFLSGLLDSVCDDATAEMVTRRRVTTAANRGDWFTRAARKARAPWIQE